MNREETIKVIQDYTEYFNKAKGQGRTVTVFDYMDSLEMNKDKAIGILENQLKGWETYYYKSPEMAKALQFAIDYMKKSEDEGEVLGWVNYYPELNRIGTQFNDQMYESVIEALKNRLSEHNAIQIPIRKPK